MANRNRYKFPPNTELVAKVKKILEEYDVPLTLRQIYYRLVVLGLQNAQKTYKNLSVKLSRFRKQGFIPWEKIIDLKRQPEKESSWTSPESFFETVGRSYKRDLQQGQEKYIEVWCEKAVAISQIVDKYDVHLLAGGGYRSSSALYEAAKRFKNIGKSVVILYLGDFDPSGLDIERDVETRMKTVFNIEVDVQRVLLVLQDIKDHNLLPNPVKPTDPRTPAYVAKYGFEDAFELDALPPDILEGKLEEAICRNIDMELYETQLKKWKTDNAEIGRFIETWNGR